ncbi:WD repeat-containing protein [Quillaja saponaria]|uniref:WD repeat-containing protein n=1 Tax=Quillaja saponaria TaxID=32244 RepID=A0AAD7QB87_QUISA|nr:WD repeat-containing protein [Quillaja saponaria]
MANCVTPGNLSTPNDSKDCNMEYSQATCQAPLQSEMNIDDSISEICEIQPLHVLNRIHQSGVNCLHVSEIKGGKRSDCSHLCSVVSGGDDQALHYLVVELSLVSTNLDVEVMTPDIRNSISGPEYVKNFTHYSQNHRKSCRIRFLDQEKILSAHSSAVKGVWTDGSWVFSTGLDQRVRCWNFTLSKLKEHASLIVSVPEPEALCARACGRNHYRITVAGRGMQMVEFSESCDMGAMNGEELNFC